MKTKLLSVLTPLSIYNDCSTCKTFGEDTFTSEEKFTPGEFTAANTRNCGHHNVRKHREVKDSNNYITLDISLKFGIMENTRIKSSDPKDNLGISGKGLITSLGLNAKSGTKKYKKARYAIGNFNMKEL